MGRTQPQKSWADPGPTASYLGLGRTDPDRRVGPESLWPIHITGPDPVWPKNKKRMNRGGIIFPPASCMQKRFCIQEARAYTRINKKCAGGGDIPGAAKTMACWRCCGEGGGNALTHGGSSRRIPNGPAMSSRFVCLVSVFSLPSRFQTFPLLSVFSGFLVTLSAVMVFLSLLFS